MDTLVARWPATKVLLAMVSWKYAAVKWPQTWYFKTSRLLKVLQNDLQEIPVMAICKIYCFIWILKEEFIRITEAFCQNCHWFLPASHEFPDALNALARQIFGAVNQKQLLYIRFAMHGMIWGSLRQVSWFQFVIKCLLIPYQHCILRSSTICSTPTNSIPLYTKNGNSWEEAQASPPTPPTYLWPPIWKIGKSQRTRQPLYHRQCQQSY